jgi:hypothetical protein
MRSLEGIGRLLAFFLLGVAMAVPAARAQTFWSQDYGISDGDVNDTFTPLNNQRFAAVDDSSNLYLCFFDNRNKSGSDNNYEIYFRRFTYNFGSPNITRVTNAYNPSKYPSMALLNWGAADTATANDSGRVYFAWQDARLFSVPTIGEPRSYVIFFRTYQSRGRALADQFGPEIQVSPYDSVSAAAAPVITITPDHKAWIVWHKANGIGTPTELYYAVYDATTQTMGAAASLTTLDAFSSSNASIAATSTGEVHVVWTDTRTGGNQIWWKMYTPGVGWGADTQIVFSTGSASAPSLCADYHGHLHLVWVDNRFGNSDIFYKEYVPGTGWDPTDVQLTLNPSGQTQPYVDADPMSNAYVVWTDQRNGSTNPDIFYKDRKAGTWSPDFELVSNLTDHDSSAVQRFPGLTHDRFGTTYVTWEDERYNSSQGKNKDVFYKYGLFNVTAAPVVPPAPRSRLFRSYPNPFNPQATIRFSLERDGVVALRAYDVQGRLVRTIVDGFLAAGVREARWDGRDDSGRGLPSGTYFLRLTAGADSQSRVVTLLK